nr:uncharacterized protein LOC113711348 [Coffea arabica]
MYWYLMILNMLRSWLKRHGASIRMLKKLLLMRQKRRERRRKQRMTLSILMLRKVMMMMLLMKQIVMMQTPNQKQRKMLLPQLRKMLKTSCRKIRASAVVGPTCCCEEKLCWQLSSRHFSFFFWLLAVELSCGFWLLALSIFVLCTVEKWVKKKSSNYSHKATFGNFLARKSFSCI